MWQFMRINSIEVALFDLQLAELDADDTTSLFAGLDH